MKLSLLQKQYIAHMQASELGRFLMEALEGNGVDMVDIVGFAGSARGYNTFGDIIFQTIDGADLNKMWQEFQRTLAFYNAKRDPLVSLLSYTVTDMVERVLYPTQDDFEEATEFGVPKGIRQGQSFNLGFDFRWYDLAIRYTWQFLIDAARAQVEALHNSALEADNRLVFQKVFKAAFNNVDRTANTFSGVQFPVYPFYNADGFVPPDFKNITFAGSHTHYVTSGAATVDPGDLQQIETDFYSHGYRQQSGYRLVILVNRSEGLVIRTFRNNVNGAIYDFIPSGAYGGGVYLPANQGIIGRPGDGAVGGLPVIGTYGPFAIVEEDYIPSGYMFAFCTAGEENFGNPVGLREHATVKGLQLVKGPQPDYPLTDSYYRRGLGSGIRHRGAGYIMQITASGSYTIPAQYA